MMTAGQDSPGGFHLKFKIRVGSPMSTNPQILRVAFLDLREASRSASFKSGSHLYWLSDAPRQLNGSGQASSRKYNRDGGKKETMNAATMNDEVKADACSSLHRSAFIVHRCSLCSVKADEHAANIRAGEFAGGSDGREHARGLGLRAPAVDGHEICVWAGIGIIDTPGICAS